MNESKSCTETLRGKNVLITGGTKGIGRATAILLAQNNATVIFVGRNKERVQKTEAEIRKLSKGRVYGYVGDVSDDNQLKKLFKFIDQQVGQLHFVINNASLGARSILDGDIKDLDYTLKVNLEAYMNCTKLALDRMIPRNSGHIVNIGSLSAIYSEKDADIYVATKAAISGFTKSIRKKVNKYSIKVSLIESGSVATEMVDENKKAKETKVKNYSFLKPEDIARVILFILLQPKRTDVMEILIKPHKQFL